MTKCFITGGAGFIGSHLVEACLEKKYHTIVLDNLSTGKKENLPLGHELLTFIEGDITDKKLLDEITKSNLDIEYVFHLAAIASVQQSMENPVETHRVNFCGTLLLLEAFRNLNIKKFVYASSAAVYGVTSDGPTKENTIPQPLSPYGADKIQGEYYLNIYNNAFNLPAVSCRFFNVFGERQNPGSPYSGVISIFFDKAVAQKKGAKTAITIYGDGRQTRDFIYVADIIQALCYLAEHKNIRGDVFNIGYGNKTTIIELAESIKRIVNVDVPIRFEQERPGDIKTSVADSTKILKTGFRFTYCFTEGLKKLADFLER